MAIPRLFTTRFLRALALLGGLALGACTSAKAICPPRPTLPAQHDLGQLRAPIRLAITFDDLPGGFDEHASWPKSRVMSELVAVLQRHQVPGPVGFVNGIYAEGKADALQGLQTWLQAGFEVASHTYSHVSANAGDAVTFLADEARNHAWLAEQLAPYHGQLRFFRYPYLERGRDVAERTGIARELMARGYRIADVSVDFADWAFSGAYARCIARADQPALDALGAAYLQNADAALYWSAESAQRVFQRPIAHVLLLHATAATAINLDALLTAYQKAGVQLISLEEALRDPSYDPQLQIDHSDNSVVWEEALRRGLKVHNYVPRDIELLDQVCR